MRIQISNRATLRILSLLFLISCSLLPFASFRTSYAEGAELNSAPELSIETGGLQGVSCITFSPDGRFMISGDAGGGAGTLKVWQVADWKLLRTVEAHHSINSILLSPDGRYILTQLQGMEQAPVSSLWRFSDGQLINSYDGFDPNTYAFSPDGDTLAVRVKDGTNLFRTSDGKLERRINFGHWTSVNPGSYSGLSFTRDMKFLLAGFSDGAVKVWDLQNGRLHKTLEGHKAPIDKLLLSPGGSYLVSVCGRGVRRIWRASDWQLLATIGADNQKWNYHTRQWFSPNDEYVAIWKESEKNVEIWGLREGKVLKTVSADVDSFAFAPDGNLVAANEYDKTRSRKTLVIYQNHGEKKILRQGSFVTEGNAIAFSIDGRFLVSGDSSSISVWNTADWRLVKSLGKTKSYLERLAFSSDGGLLASVGSEGGIRIWNPLEGKLLYTLLGKKENYSAHFSPDGKILAAGGKKDTSTSHSSYFNKAITLWAVPGFKPIANFGENDVSDLSFSPDGRLLASAGKEGEIWQIPEGRLFKKLGKKHERSSFSSDGKLLISGGDHVNIWKSPTFDFLKTIDKVGDIEAIGHVTVSRDGLHLAYDKIFIEANVGRVHILDLPSFRPVRTIEAGAVLAFSPDSKLLAIENKDHTNVSLSRISDGKAVHTFSGRGPLAFNSRGDIAATDSLNRVVKLYKYIASDKNEYVHLANLCAFENGEYVVFTPDGYYDSSPEGGPSLNWTFSNEPWPETFSFEQFAPILRRPDIIRARLQGDINAGKPAPRITRPPYIEMQEHQNIKETTNNTYPLKLNTLASDEVKTLRVFVNGKPALDVPVNAKEKSLSLDVTLFSGTNRITAIAYNEKGFSSNPRYMDVLCKRTDLIKPDLYVFGIGVSKYPILPQEWQLSFAHSDAKSMLESFKIKEGHLFSHVKTKLLTNQEANPEAISDVFQSLEAIQENDVAVIFLAGHGIMAKDGTFYFLTSSGSLEEPEKGGISWKVLGERLAAIKGRVLLLLDACHSGNISTETVVPNDELAQKLRSEGRSGIMVFAASKGRQSALESPDLGGGFGVFAYAVTQALGPKAKEADLNANGYVEFMELVDHVSKTVDKETEGEQTPWLSRKELFGDFAIAVVQ